MSKKIKVAVVGGGPSGLLCAYLLNKKVPQAEVTIFNASPRLGGKLMTDQFTTGEKFEAGLSELGGDQLEEMLAELGLDIAPMSGLSVVVGNRILRDIDEVEREYGEETRKKIEEDLGDAGDEPYHISGGLSALTDQLLSKVRATLRPSTRVIGVSKGSEQYQMVQRDGFEQSYKKLNAQYELTLSDSGSSSGTYVEGFDCVFMCLPIHWLSLINFDKDIEQALAEVFSTNQVCHHLRVSMLYNKPWWNREGIAGDYWLMDCLGGCVCYNESARWRSTSGHVLSIVICDPVACALSTLDDESVVEYVLDHLPEFMRKKARKKLVEAQVNRSISSCPTAEALNKYGGIYLCEGSTVEEVLQSAQDAVDSLLSEVGN